MVRKDCYDKRQWHSSNVNAYSSSSIDAWLNNDYKNMLYYSIRMVIGTTKFYYTPGNGNTTMGTLDRAVFLLSAYELGKSESWFNKEGTTLPNATNYQIAKLNGSAVIQWTRSPRTDDASRAFCLNTSGGVGSLNCAGTLGSRPAFTLPSNLYVWGDGTVSTESGPTPSTIHTPTISIQGQPITVSWSSVSGADSYILQRNADNGGWTQVYAGPLTTFTDTAGTWSTVQYQVCGVFSGTNGAFAQSDSITVVAASALVISGQDGDLGTITNDIPYSVNSDTSNDITLVRTVNGAQVATATVQTGFSYNIPVLDLPTGTNTIVITATVTASSGQVTATRTWTYTKPAQPFPASGGVAALTKDGKPLFPQTLAECVRTIGGPWGGDLGKALEKLARAATFSRDRQAKYTEVKVDLGKVKAGDIVNLPVKGIMTSHIVVQVGNPDPAMYDASCDGVWLLRQNIVENGQWNSTNVNTLKGSTIMTTMQGYVTDYDSTVQAAIQTVKIPYCVGGGDTTVNTLANGLECKMFPLGGYEVGFTTINNSSFPVDGAVLAYFKGTASTDSKRISYFNGSASQWWLRSLYTGNTSDVWCVTYNGGNEHLAPNNSRATRPCFLLPTTFTATYYVDAAGAVHPSQEYTNGGDFYDLLGNIIPTAKIATGSYVGTGTYGVDNPNTLTFSFEPKIVFVIPLGSNNNGPGILYPAFYTEAYISYAYISQSSVSGVATLTQAFENYANLVGKTVSWYAASNTAQKQLNISGAKYYYIAIG
ncbi:DUF6273 domain-containing protein [uncultured Intestinimonas sp.]|uniref:DUF6273 domain-containing protein n=1 Tax=uncultured Intestinimonas sp. TaxID=1689265 RepID=UPI0029432736|nr:DUF6273 domain-containing protein [uncultured Intestinimonas sp.]